MSSSRPCRRFRCSLTAQIKTTTRDSSVAAADSRRGRPPRRLISTLISPCHRRVGPVVRCLLRRLPRRATAWHAVWVRIDHRRSNANERTAAVRLRRGIYDSRRNNPLDAAAAAFGIALASDVRWVRVAHGITPIGPAKCRDTAERLSHVPRKFVGSSDRRYKVPITESISSGH